MQLFILVWGMALSVAAAVLLAEYEMAIASGLMLVTVVLLSGKRS